MSENIHTESNTSKAPGTKGTSHTSNNSSQQSKIFRLITCQNPYALIGFSIACVVIGILCYKFSNGSLAMFTFITAMVVLSFFIGCITTVLVVRASVRRADSHIFDLMRLSTAKNFATKGNDDEKTSYNVDTGMSELDNLIVNTRRSIIHLLEILSSVGLEVEDLVDRYEVLTNNLAASVIIRNTNGKIIFSSPYSEVLTGYSMDEIYDTEEDFFECIVQEEDLDRYKRSMMISKLGEDIVVRYQICHKSGMTLWIESHLVPICNGDGEIVSTMSVSIDVTASVRYQQRIEEQNRDLSDFTYMVSHDLKAPIFTIKGMASLLIEDYAEALDQDAFDSIQYIVNAADRLEALIKSVIDYSSLSTYDIEEEDIELDNVIKQVLGDLSQQIKDANALINIDPTLPSVAGDPVRLYQVFSNLIGNALKYRSPERRVEISVKVRDSSCDLTIIDIVDNGLGIPKDKLSNVFRPYHRAHGNEIEGNGIGLACVKKILDKLEGSITVASVEGKGSVFTVILKHSSKKHSQQPGIMTEEIIPANTERA